jgi:chloramphenicol 3-O phosphotransferase
VVTIVVLNGASSSGKTSIAHAFQDLAPETFLNISVDTILSALPPSMIQRINRGELIGRDTFHRLVRAFHGCVTAVASLEHHLVIDHTIRTRAEAEMLVEAVGPHRAFLVGLDCPVGVLESRERQRGDRAPGLAASQQRAVHDWLEYDLVIDTSATAVAEAARQIVSLLATEEAEGLARTRAKLV